MTMTAVKTGNATDFQNVRNTNLLVLTKERGQWLVRSSEVTNSENR